MKAVILAGGSGTRLAPYTANLPKPLVALRDKPILNVIIRQLQHHGITDITLAVGHRAEMLAAYFGDGSQFGVRITYSHEKEPLGTAGPLALVPGLTERFLVMNGDLLTPLNFNDMLERHILSGALCTVAVNPQEIAIDIYGQTANPNLPISETSPLQPRSIYALSKAAQDLMAQQFFLEHGLHVVRGRTFNQTGPREPAGLVCSALASQLARIEAGLQAAVLRVTSLESSRDFCDVRDVVAGYWGALEHGAPGEAYNICSGTSHRIRQVVDLLLTHADAAGVSVEEAQPHPEPRAILNQVGDLSRLRACSGWSPAISLEQSLGDLLEEWRLKTRRKM